MPALILAFYGNGTVVEYVKDQDNDARLEVVFVFWTLGYSTNPSDDTSYR